jgi:hypothetical protein
MATTRKKKAKAKPPTRAVLHSRFVHPTPEELDLTPVAMPAGYGQPKTLREMLATMVREYVEMEREGDQFESWDEANDFEPDVEEDYLLDMSPYTFTDLQDEPETASEAPQETNSSPDKVEPEEMKASQEATEAGLEPQNDLPE